MIILAIIGFGAMLSLAVLATCAAQISVRPNAASLHTSGAGAMRKVYGQHQTLVFWYHERTGYEAQAVVAS